jgi:hypothetical protein
MRGSPGGSSGDDGKREEKHLDVRKLVCTEGNKNWSFAAKRARDNSSPWDERKIGRERERIKRK